MNKQKMYEDAIAISNGACNPTAIACTIERWCSELTREEGTDACRNPAIALMAYQLGHLTGANMLDDTTRYLRATEACERGARGEDPDVPQDAQSDDDVVDAEFDPVAYQLGVATLAEMWGSSQEDVVVNLITGAACYLNAVIAEPDADGNPDYRAIRSWMDAKSYWPNVWEVNDHGNISLVGIQPDGTVTHHGALV